MFWLASFLGLIGIGGAALLDFSAETADQTDADTEPADDELPITPANTFLDGESAPSDSGVEQVLENCDFVKPEQEPQTNVVSLFSGPPLTGTSGIDFLGGTENSEQIIGLDGNDQVNGYAGTDAIDGGEGDDTLRGGDGDDSLSGGHGQDHMHGEDGADSLRGNSGDDSLWGHSGADTLQGGDGDDSAHGGQGHDHLHGEAGDDALHGNDGNDTLQGGDGQDSLFGGRGDDVIWGADDGGENDFLNGGDGDDTLLAGSGDIVTAGEGSDQIWTSEGADDAAAIQLLDFDPEEDQLVVFWSPDNETPPVVEIDHSAADQQIIRINGNFALRLSGAEGLTAEDIVLIPQA